MVCNKVGGASSNYNSLHLLFTALHEVRQVVFLGNISSRVNLHRDSPEIYILPSTNYKH